MTQEQTHPSSMDNFSDESSPFQTDKEATSFHFLELSLSCVSSVRVLLLLFGAAALYYFSTLNTE